MGFSLGEIFLLIIVGIIVVGPKRLPGMMRTAGQWVSRLRRMSMDLRSQSGIDDLLRQEGLEQHLHELRSLSRLNVVDTLMAPAVSMGGLRADSMGGLRPPKPPEMAAGARGLLDAPSRGALGAEEPLRDREYPLIGCDAYGALPDDAAMYVPRPAVAAETPVADPPAQPDVTEALVPTPPAEPALPVAEAPAEQAPGVAVADAPAAEGTA